MADSSNTIQRLIAENAALKKRIGVLKAVERKRNVLHQAILSHSPLVISVIDTDGRYLLANPALGRFFRLPPTQVTGKTLSELLPLETANAFMNRIAHVKKTREPINVEENLQTDDGMHHFITRLFPLIDETGNLLNIGTIAQDITKLRRTEEKLRDSERDFRSIFDHATIGIATIESQTGRIIRINQTFCDIVRYLPHEIIDADFLHIQLTHPDDLQADIDNMDRLRTGQIKSFSIDKRYFAKDGTIIWVNLTVIPLMLEKDKLSTHLAVVVDISDRKRAEEEKLNIERRLFQAQKLESIGTLAAGIVHDFNNLLTGIRGNASLMMMDIDPAHPHYKRLHHLEEHVASAAELTGQLLGFSQKRRHNVKPVSMNELLSKTAAMFGRTKKEINIHEKYAAEPCIVEVDRSQMEQIFMNLFVNAWQAMPGGGDIFIETAIVVLDDTPVNQENVKPGKYVKITVTDTGIGMDMEIMERIFDPFFTTKKRGIGTGLGLTSVYGIIKGHKGVINVSSEPGKGATFTLYIRASEVCSIIEKKPAKEVLQGTETILLVDDEKTILNVVQDMLEFLGYHVHAAGSGKEALALYSGKNDEIALVILDMLMPGMSGSDTFDQLRQINPAVKVLLSSGLCINEQGQTITDRGYNGFIQKPFHLEKLSQIVREILDEGSRFQSVSIDLTGRDSEEL